MHADRDFIAAVVNMVCHTIARVLDLGSHKPRVIRGSHGYLTLTLEDLRRDRDVFRNATLVELLRHEELGEERAGPFGEWCRIGISIASVICL